jgi:hypothetical protein
MNRRKKMKTELLHTAVENLIQNGRKTLAERMDEAAHLTESEVDVLRLMGSKNNIHTYQSRVFEYGFDVSCFGGIYSGW